jgi:hypothetical protein
MGRPVRFYQALGFTLRAGGEDAPFTSFHGGSGVLNLIAVPAMRPCSWQGKRIMNAISVATTRSCVTRYP